ncbi:uncharacterized protein LOC144026295 [Festucalex cinctus]
MESTPTPPEELQLIQAGLGKRTLSITSDITHTQLSSLLKEAYPRMNILEDRWILFKAAGGNGRRKMSAIALEAEGYTGSLIKRASSGGKFVLYVVPLQDELDLTPLPADSPKFALMPKATLKNCKMEMPLQMLALHIDQCSGTSDFEDEESDVLCLDEVASPSSAPGCISDVPQSSGEHCFHQASDVKCPICTQEFPESEIELHASFCSDRMEKNVCQLNTAETFPGLDQISCEDDVLQWLSTQIDRSKTFEMCVSRDGIVDRGLKLWKRRKNGSPVNPLKVSFLGEAGVDTGALRKEFLSTMVAGIENRLFEGESKKGKVPKYSISNLDDELFKAAGEIFAVSLAQGGPAPRFLQEWCYHYLVNGNLKAEGTDDTDLSPFIRTVDSHYILAHLAPVMSPRGSVKHSLESKILEHFQDFLLELEDAEDVVDGNPSVPEVMQWITGQGHKHLLMSDREQFKITINFDHNCEAHMPGHTVCYPLVSACTNTVTFPTTHMGDYHSFKSHLLTALKFGAGFDRV